MVKTTACGQPLSLHVRTHPACIFIKRTVYCILMNTNSLSTVIWCVCVCVTDGWLSVLRHCKWEFMKTAWLSSCQQILIKRMHQIEMPVWLDVQMTDRETSSTIVTDCCCISTRVRVLENNFSDFFQLFVFVFIETKNITVRKTEIPKTTVRSTETSQVVERILSTESVFCSWWESPTLVYRDVSVIKSKVFESLPPKTVNNKINKNYNLACSTLG